MQGPPAALLLLLLCSSSHRPEIVYTQSRARQKHSATRRASLVPSFPSIIHPPFFSVHSLSHSSQPRPYTYPFCLSSRSNPTHHRLLDPIAAFCPHPSLSPSPITPSFSPSRIAPDHRGRRQPPSDATAGQKRSASPHRAGRKRSATATAASSSYYAAATAATAAAAASASSIPRRPAWTANEIVRTHFCDVVVEGAGGAGARELGRILRWLGTPVPSHQSHHSRPSTSSETFRPASAGGAPLTRPLSHTRFSRPTLTRHSRSNSVSSVLALANGERSDDDASIITAGGGGGGVASRSSFIGNLFSKASGHAGPLSSKMRSRLRELLETERSYVRRIETLYKSYALPLRRFSRDKDTAIIPPFEARALFGNVAEICEVNRAFLEDLEALEDKLEEGRWPEEGIGELVKRHMENFSCYSEYLSGFEQAKQIEALMSKKSGFIQYVERVKYSTPGVGNVGLRELLMEPVQRIPRYKLLFEGMLKHMPAADPQRVPLLQAIEAASRIASCEANESTKRAAIVWALDRAIEGFPASMVSSTRTFIDCLDVDDVPLDMSTLAFPATSLSPPPSSTAAAASSSREALHCTLFLFSDLLAIVKRQSSTTSGRKLAGLDDLNRLCDRMKMYTSGGAGGFVTPSGKGKIHMSWKGIVELADLTALDVGGEDFQLTFSRPPLDQTDRWSGRPVRHYVSRNAPAASFSSRVAGAYAHRGDKARFLQNLWRAQALCKTRDGRSEARLDECVVVASLPSSSSSSSLSSSSAGDVGKRKSEERGRIRNAVWWNVYERRAWLGEPYKGKLVLHVDSSGRADPLPFGVEHAPPHTIVRLGHFDDDVEFGEYSVRTKASPSLDEDDEDMERTTVLMSKLPSTIVELSESLPALTAPLPPSVLELRPQRSRAGSNPTTPTNNVLRTRGHLFGLETISRNLFSSASRGVPLSASAATVLNGPGSANATPTAAGVSGGGALGGGGHRRTKSIAARSANGSDTISTATTSRSSAFTDQTKSTAPTSVGAVEDDKSNNRERSSSEAGAEEKEKKKEAASVTWADQADLSPVEETTASAAINVASSFSSSTSTDPEEREREISRLRGQLQASKQTCDTLRALEQEVRAENTTLYEAFNEELDRMYDDTAEPEDAELLALREEVRAAKAELNGLKVENGALRRDLRLQNDLREHYEAVLRAHDLL